MMASPLLSRLLLLLLVVLGLDLGHAPSGVEARGVQVNLTAAWPSSPLYPLLETSEFLAEENPLYFWRYVAALGPHEAAIEAHRADPDALTALAIDVAQEVAPNTRNILELTIATRTYSAKVEMFRQLALDSGARVCDGKAEAWALVYKEHRCIRAVACTAEELAVALTSAPSTTASAKDQCIAAAVHDVELRSVDHKHPHSSREAETVLLYGLIGTPSFAAFHKVLEPMAAAGNIAYIVRHFPKDSTLDTLLQGYGISLDIKNMEYKTIDDSKKTGGDTASEPEEEEEEEFRDDDEDEEDDEGSDEEDVDGIYFSRLIKLHPPLKTQLRAIRNQLIQKHEQDNDIKAWHLKDIGIAAAKEILDAKNPLKRLRVLSQDFPKHAKKLAFTRKSLPDALRVEADHRRHEATQMGLLNRFLLNGIPVDPMQRSFNIFDFMNTLKTEWLLAKKLAALPLTKDEREGMLSSVREAKEDGGVVRIRVRGPVDGTAPLYLNDIETDYLTHDWNDDVDALRRPAWNLIFIRKNMYEYVLAFDPTSPHGRQALTQIAFLRMRGAPIQWGMLMSTKELVEAKSAEERSALVTQYKTADVTDRANGWHFAKFLVMAKAKGAVEKGEMTGRVVAAFIEGAADESGELTVQNLMNCYLDATGGSFSKGKYEKIALELLRSDEFDEEVMSMTVFIGKKHLPFESALFNGVLKSDLDVQSDIMNHFGRDQGLYQAMARTGEVSGDLDLVSELLTAQEAYPAYFSIFSGKELDNGEKKSPNHLFANDENQKLETLVRKHVTYLHQANSITSPKKQSLLFVADLGIPVHAAHVYEAVKATQEDLGGSMRVGVIHYSMQKKTELLGELAAAVLHEVGHSDDATHIKVVAEVLGAIAKAKTLEAVKAKVAGVVERIPDWSNDVILAKIHTILRDSAGEALRSTAKSALDELKAALNHRPDHSSACVYLNGFRVDLPTHAISAEDLAALINFDMKHRSQPIAKSFIKRSTKYTAEEANARSTEIVKASAMVDDYRATERYAGLEFGDSSLISMKLPGDEALHVVAYVDPLSEAAQRMSSLLVMLRNQLNASVELVILPASDYSEFPLQRFYRYLFDKKPARLTSITFRKLPIKPILTMKIDTPEAWNVQVHQTADDLDNLRVDPDSAADVRAVKSAAFCLESLLVYGQCRDKTFDQYAPPNGLQLVLERDVGAERLHRDTLVMKNLGYFQLQATPGVWNLHLARGRAVELFDIVDRDTDMALPSTDVLVTDFSSHIEQLLVRKRPGKEYVDLLAPSSKSAKGKPAANSDPSSPSDQETIFDWGWNSVKTMLGIGEVADSAPSDVGNSEALVSTPGTNVGRTGETIHVFSLASGHLYERFLKIMMLSVLKRTENPVTFWLLENFLSPDFKASIPALQAKFGMDIRLVTYKWPNWLRQQTQKQRIIWGYKILFLDVLFPLGVQKIIYVDADQVVRADLKELWEMDLNGAPYGYTPFCDSRNVGFQFWRQGYWKDHLRGRPYHISALYVVDLALFRQMAAGDMLRAIYDQLSADPNSLSNLDQDLPNYAQHQIKIHSLPQEWLWCESWCSDDSKAKAKTIDLCNNPKHKEPKLDMAKRVISGELFNESWLELDKEIKDAEVEHVKPVN